MPVLILILILILIVVVVAVGAFVMIRRKSQAPHAAPTAPQAESHPPEVPPPPPMIDLESALSQVTDSTGRPIRDHIDAETDHVDELRVPDDTGPLLRRALDHVEKPADDEATVSLPGDAGDDPSDGADTAPAH